MCHHHDLTKMPRGKVKPSPSQGWKKRQWICMCVVICKSKVCTEDDLLVSQGVFFIHSSSYLTKLLQRFLNSGCLWQDRVIMRMFVDGRDVFDWMCLNVFYVFIQPPFNSDICKAMKKFHGCYQDWWKNVNEFWKHHHHSDHHNHLFFHCCLWGMTSRH